MVVIADLQPAHARPHCGASLTDSERARFATTLDEDDTFLETAARVPANHHANDPLTMRVPFVRAFAKYKRTLARCEAWVWQHWQSLLRRPGFTLEAT